MENWEKPKIVKLNITNTLNGEPTDSGGEDS